MPLGRFAAYFFLLMAVCLVAFPRSVGAPPPSAAQDVAGVPPPCSEDSTSEVTCVSPLLALSMSQHRTPPALRRWREAGESAPPPPTFLAGPSRDRRPLDS